MGEFTGIQWRRLQRYLRSLGLHPAVGLCILILLFGLLSWRLMVAYSWGPYVYLLLMLYLGQMMGRPIRRHAIRQWCGPGCYWRIRLWEQLLLSLPFVLVLLIFKDWWLGLLAVVLSLFSLWAPSFSTGRFSLPLPFGKKPFEYTTGLRKHFWLLLVVLFFVVMGFVVANPGLSVFGFTILMVLPMGWMGQVEPVTYLWQHSQPPSAFLWQKWLTGLEHLCYLGLPLALFLGVVLPGMSLAIAVVFVVGVGAQTAVLLAKYASYPRDIDFVHAILVATGIVFLPVLVVILPFLGRKAIANLKQYLP
jgi:hypothetical protein